MDIFTLTATKFAMSAEGMTWRWALTGSSEAVVHNVRLGSGEWQYEAFTDLFGWLEHYAEPLFDKVESEERIVAALGDWISRNVFGEIARVLADAAPCTIRIVLPHAAAELAFLPLALARVGDQPLAVQQVSLVIDAATAPPSGPRAVRSAGRNPAAPRRLRVLGLFSLPDGSGALNLRRERHELERMVGELAASGRAIEIRSLQYGATRQKLAEAVADRGGWDVVHLSGHGRAGTFMLEKADGSPDPVSGDELVKLLLPLRGRVSLVTVSSCDSGERVARRQREMLADPGVTAREAQSDEAGDDAIGPAGSGRALAAELARRLGCAVVGMRYPVAEPFAAALAAGLYSLLFARNLPLASALASAMATAGAGYATVDRPALSVGAPALYSASAIDLRLVAPQVSTRTPRAGSRLAGFPVQPGRFVGRVPEMSRAAQALAPGSGCPAVVIHGMPGAGKTAFALELAYTQRDNFTTFVWYTAPDESADPAAALTHLARTMEQKIDGLKFAHLVDDPAGLDSFLPRLTALFAQQRILLVIDNAGSLLTPAGNWREQRWQRVVGALTGHTGLGRLIITTRFVITGVGPALEEPVGALSETEAVLLARELPGLRALLDGTAPPLNETAARGLAHRVMKATSGHPAMLDLADGQGEQPLQLAKSILVIEQACTDARTPPGLPQAVGPARWLPVIDGWTGQVSRCLDPSARLLFGILCCLEPDDRERGTLDDVWPHLWRALGRPGDPPAPDTRAIAASGLMGVEHHVEADGLSNSDFLIHPVVAAVGRADAGRHARHLVDRVLADYWSSLFVRAVDHEDAKSHSVLVRYVGEAALPYLLRLGDWDAALYLIQEMLGQDDSPAAAARLRPALRTTASTATGTDAIRAERLHAVALARVDVETAEQQLRALLSAALGADDHRTASVLAGDLSDILVDAGKLDQALAAAEQKIQHTRRAGLGPWTVLGAQVQRLRVLAIQGKAKEVLGESQRLRDRIGPGLQTAPEPSLPDDGPDETAKPWSVREVLMDLGREAACQLQRWDDALSLSAETARSQARRRASSAELRRTYFNDYFPLLKLGRLDEAREVLYACKATAEADNDIAALGKTLGALADVEDKLGHGDLAVVLDRAALRYKYQIGDADGIASGHNNYGRHLARLGGDVATAFAHILAAAVTRALTRVDGLDLALQAAALLVSELPAQAAPARTLGQLSRFVSQVPGVDFARLLERLEPDPSTRDEAYGQVLTRVAGLATAADGAASAGR